MGHGPCIVKHWAKSGVFHSRTLAGPWDLHSRISPGTCVDVSFLTTWPRPSIVEHCLSHEPSSL
jgi:hypothetical protein